MIAQKRLFVLFCSFCVFCLVFSFQSSCFAEKTFRITESQLVMLENNLKILEKNNEELALEYRKVKTLLNQSEVSQKQILNLSNVQKSQLIKLENLSKNQELQLKTANESFQKFASQERLKQSRLRKQRDIAYGVGIAALLYCFHKAS